MGSGSDVIRILKISLSDLRIVRLHGTTPEGTVYVEFKVPPYSCTTLRIDCGGKSGSRKTSLKAVAMVEGLHRC